MDDNIFISMKFMRFLAIIIFEKIMVYRVFDQ